jgi:DNA-binding NarL/FixJ family response regulator
VPALLVEGLTGAQIAERLPVSTATVRLHAGRLLSTLQAPDRTAAAPIAVESALV